MTADARPAEIRLLPGHHKRVKAGHPWIYSNEIAMDAATKALPRGGAVRAIAASGEALGLFTFNPHTLIAGRLLDRDPQAVIDGAWIAARLARALALRERIHPGGFYRWVHAEADGLPGLILDRYGAVVSMQANTAGMELITPQILEAVATLVGPAAVMLRNDAPARGLEGLPAETRLAAGVLDGPVEIVENGARFLIDPGEGQKTGWFFDQRENRALVASFAADARVLDLYSYAGGFTVQAARAGAAMATAVDRSAAALALAERSAALNGVAERCRFVRAEVFETAERLDAEGARFEVVVADPPAFVKSKKDLGAGLRAYRKLARLSARLTAPGGILFIASCSHNVTTEAFMAEVARGLWDAGRDGRILRTVGAAADHPVHPMLPESAYLKGALIQLD